MVSMSIYAGYLSLFCLLTPTLQLTIAVLTGPKPDGVKPDNQTTFSSKYGHVQLVTRCEMETSANGKFFNCSSTPPDVSTSPPLQARISREQKKQCGSNSHLVGESCLCNPGWKKFPFSDLCVREEGASCQFAKNDCSTDMTYMSCVNSVCACENSDVFDSISLRCMGKVGGLCFPGIKDCVMSAECVNIPQTANEARFGSDSDLEQLRSSSEYAIPSTNDIELSGRCECKEGYVESSDGFCRKGYGQDCESSDECDSVNLVCREGICLCQNSVQIYEWASKSCLSLAGARCTDQDVCVKGAYCKKANLQNSGGRCTCGEDAKETRMRTCSRPTSTAQTMMESPSYLEDNSNSGSSRFLFDYL